MKCKMRNSMPPARPPIYYFPSRLEGHQHVQSRVKKISTSHWSLMWRNFHSRCSSRKRYKWEQNACCNVLWEVQCKVIACKEFNFFLFSNQLQPSASWQRMITTRIQHYIDYIQPGLHLAQAGFWPNMGTHDCLWLLHGVINHMSPKQMPDYILAVDMRKAFDNAKQVILQQLSNRYPSQKAYNWIHLLSRWYYHPNRGAGLPKWRQQAAVFSLTDSLRHTGTTAVARKDETDQRRRKECH